MIFRLEDTFQPQVTPESDRYVEQLREAILQRHSVRNYLDRPLEDDIIKKLREKIGQLNETGNLHIQLITDEPKAFKGVFAYGKFSGVKNYFVVAGKKGEDLDYRVGYYGEELVLFCQSLGLNTCWVGLSYRKVANTYQLADGEKIACYISVGYGETGGRDHKRKSLSEVSNASPATPEWFADGVEAALLAPTAINQQKFRFEYIGREKGDLEEVKADKGFSIVGYTKMDLGIARLHFEIGAYPHPFRWR